MTGSNAGSWWQWHRALAAVVTAVAVAVTTFTFRFNALEGTLGGFEDDHFATLMRAEMLLDGQQPLRDFVDFELRGAWPSLSYALPAWAQQLVGRTLLAEAYLTLGALAVAYALVFVLGLALSRRWWIGLLAASLAAATAPKPYNYPKVLMLTLGALAIRAVALNPSWPRLALASVISSIAVLFRHDYGVYLAVGVIVGLVARDAERWRSALRSVSIYLGLMTVCLLPSAIWVQVYEGIPAYLRNTLLTSSVEMRRTELRLPSLELSSFLDRDTLAALTYYAFWVVLVVAAAVLLWRCVARAAPRLSPEDRGTAAGLLAMALIATEFFLRSNLTQRFGDAIVPVALLATWCVGAASGVASRDVRRLMVAIPAVLLTFILAASYVFADVATKLRAGGLSVSWDQTVLRFQEVHDALRQLPPGDWSGVEMQGILPAARYVALCTRPEDYLLVAGYAPEIYVLARRRFAAGQGTVSLSFYTSDADQRRALGRLERQSVPVILAEADEYEEGFVSDYPLLARHVADHYREAGTLAVEGEPRFRVFVRADRTPQRTDGESGLPCYR